MSTPRLRMRIRCWVSRSSLTEWMECKHTSFMFDDEFSFHTLYRHYWEFRQLNTLQYIVQPDTWDISEKLSKTLNELYEHMLTYINKNNQECAHCLLHCVAVFHHAPCQGAHWHPHISYSKVGIPKICRQTTKKVLSAYVFKLVTIVDKQGSWVMQFFHLSV